MSRSRISAALAAGALIISAPTASALLYSQDAQTDSLADSTAYIMVGGLSYCSGTVVDDSWVITAEHCFDNSEEGQVKIGADRNGETKTISQVVFPSTADDVALVQLDSPTTATPIELHTGDDLPEGTPGVAMGWGGDATDVGPFDKIQESTGKTLEGRYQVNPMPDMSALGFEMDSSAVTTGDSGGPLFVDGKLYGVLSMFSPVTPVPNEANTGWYASASDIAEWVADTTGQELPSPTTSDDPEPTSTSTTSGDTPVISTDTSTPTTTSSSPTVSTQAPTSSYPTQAPTNTQPRQTIEDAEVVGVNPNGALPVANETEFGPKVDTGGTVKSSWLDKVANIFD